MKSKTIVWIFVLLFVVYCGVRVWNTGLFSSRPFRSDVGIISLAAVAENQAADEGSPAPEEPKDTAVQEEPAAGVESIFSRLSAVSGPEETAVLGQLYDTVERSMDPDRYKFQIELTTRGAAIRKVTLSEFDDRDPNNPQPFVLLAPVSAEAAEVYSLASRGLRITEEEAAEFGAQAFPLQKLNWTLTEHDQNHAVFEALLGEVEADEGRQMFAEPQIRLQKIYRIQPGSYDLTCEMTVENLTGQAARTSLEMQGTGFMKKEDIRMDGRKVFAAYQVETEEHPIETRALGYLQLRGYVKELDCPQDRQGFSLLFYQLGKLFKGLFGGEKPDEALLMEPEKDAAFVWAASANKYFAAIVRPVEMRSFSFVRAQYLDADLCRRQPSDRAAGSYLLQSEPLSLAAAGAEGSRQTLTFDVFLGPKDKPLFDKNETYRKYAYFQTFAMRSCCCCPDFITQPLAFAIMWLMNALYHLMGPWGNYGVVIMFLVFVMRLIMHPITKKSQVTMMKVQKLGPELQAVQKKYRGNPQELQRKMAEVYQQHGMTQFSPMVGMLPMFLQMPIWIALWTAVYTSIDLRGAGFLPFWITDLSAPDALIRFGKEGFTIPLLGFTILSLNMLPILMGVVMYLQQKLMPHSQPAADPEKAGQMAQQQKIMMVMMPLLFPIMLYNGPSGVNLYIMSSIGAGVIEQYVIRKHLQEQEAEREKNLVPVTSKTGGKVKKKKPKPFFREYR